MTLSGSGRQSAGIRISRRERLLEIVVVLLLGITTVGTAWCGYQASRWNGQQDDLAQLSSDQRVEGSRLFGLASQKVAYDSSLLVQYAQAAQAHNEPLLKFYRTSLVRPDFLPVLQKWEAQVRAGQTPTNLFQDTAYMDAQFADYRATVVKAEVATQASKEAAANANDYVVTTILLAVGLFFAGVTSSFRYYPARFLMVLLAVATVAAAAVRLADLPVK
ncbi:hypothetical protein ACSMXN_06615 [Jatrophihabitans sp. DSM 45814]